MPKLLNYLPLDVTGLLAEGKGVFTVADAAACGVTPGRLHRLVRAGLLVLVAAGVYASSAQLSASTPWQAHALRSRGFAIGCPPGSFATEWSAVAIRGLPALRPPPALPVVVQPDRLSNPARTRFGRILVATVDPANLRLYAGCPVVSQAWTVVDLARKVPKAHALVLVDAALRQGTSTRALEHVAAGMRGWPGTRQAEWVVEHGDGRAETPLETLGRLSCIEGGLPVPLSNVWVGDGYPLYRLDHLWPYHWVAAEGDGALKYSSRGDAAAVVAAEKEREWILRRLGLEVVRYGWDLAARRRGQLTTRFAQVLSENPERSTPVQWWPTESPFIAADGGLLY